MNSGRAYRVARWVWVEDDAPVPDRERWHEAYRRIFQRPIPDAEETVQETNFGDAIEYLFRDGTVVAFSCEGARLGRALYAID